MHSWPLIAVHAALTPDGRVLTYGTDGDGRQTGYFLYDVWDPEFGLTGGHMTLDNMTLTDLFCSSQIILPQTGDILITGGDNWTGYSTTNIGNNASNLFDYGDNTLARSVDMHRERWYASSTVLVDGEVYIQGGNGGGDRPEVRQLDGSFRLLSNVATDPYFEFFPRNFLAPDGRVFGYDGTGKMYFVDPSGSGSLVSAGQFSSSYVGWTSGAAMFEPGKILQMGGNSPGVVVIDINGPEPVLTPTASLSSRRHWVSATVLPNGKVLATGGSDQENKLIGVNNKVEIWDPATGSWHIGSEGARARLYHSSALLLPDASVLIAGGGAPGPQNNTNAEIFYPPYLFDASNQFATRPEIVSAPDTVSVGDTLAIETGPATLSRVTIVKSGSVTHSVNMDQRFLELPFSTSGNMVYATLPSRASDTPPGFYLLFVLDEFGVPSIASILRINIDPTPEVAVDYTAAIGGAGGAPFRLACKVDEVLVGVHGRTATYVNQIGPQCVRMDQFGHWIGDPVSRPVTGTTNSGTAFAKTCPRDFAVSGFQGRAGQYVNQLNVECRALTSAGGLTGNGEFLGADGGNGGTQQGLKRCSTGNPGHALFGRSGGWLDNFGLQCKEGFTTTISVSSSPVIVYPGEQSGTVGIAVELQITATDGDNDVLTFSATGLPSGLNIDTATGLITGTPDTAGTFNADVTVSDGNETDNAVFQWIIDAAPPLVVAPMPTQPPREVDTVVNYTVSSDGGVNPVYKWNFGDGSPETAYSSSPSVSYTFMSPGIHYVTLTADDDYGDPQVQTFVQGIHLPKTTNSPASSSNIVYVDGGTGASHIWVANPDNDSVTMFDAATNGKVAEIDVGSAPRSLAAAPDGRIWVTNTHSANISIIDPVSRAVTQTLAMRRGSRPYGVVMSPVANEVFVVLEGAQQLLKLDATNGVQLGAFATGPNPRHVAIDSFGSRLYVSRFITPPQPGEHTEAIATTVDGENVGGEVLVVDSGSLTLIDTLVLQHSDFTDAENQARGVPNYVGAVAISPDGTSARVPSKQDNIARGDLRDPGFSLNFQSTVRAISSYIDIAGNTERLDRRIDYDDSSLANAIAFEPSGIYAFVALETSREVAVVDVYDFAELFRFDTGMAPQGLVVSSDGRTLYVNNFMDRTVSVYDLTELQTTGLWNVPAIATLQSIATEQLDAQTLLGKQLFYDARDTRLARDRYLSCASCHNEGGQDGRTWDFTGFGEGVRNTISLRGGGASEGRLHWTDNFDEVQDFEGQIRALAGGTGLMANVDFFAGTRREPLGDAKAGISSDLDALATYVVSLVDYDESPYRESDGSMTAEGAAGRDVFRRENCAACHSGSDFTDSRTDTEFTDGDGELLHDIGTITPASGKRLSQPLTGLATPTLRGLSGSAPYLHDGSAATLSDAVAAHDGVNLNVDDMASLVSYLRQINETELVAPVPNVPPTITDPGDQTSETGSAVNLAIEAQDIDGGTLSFIASGLPTGLTINSETGVIDGTPTTAAGNVVTVTVSDGESTASITFNWIVADANVPPTISNPGDQESETGTAVNLTLEAADSDGGILSFAASNLPDGLSISVISGVISGTPNTADIYSVTVTVDDGEDSASTSFSWTITERNVSPTIANPGDQVSGTGSDVSLTIQANDSNGDTLSFSASGLPSGLSIDSDTGVITGNVALAGNYLATVTVSDGEFTDSTTFGWAVTDDNIPPTIRDPGGQVSEAGTYVSLAIVANDGNNDVLSYSATGLPTGLSISGSSGVISGTPTTLGDYVVTVFVNDGEESAASSFDWTVVEPNAPPTINSIGNMAHYTGTNINLQVEAHDDDGDDLTFVASSLPVGLAINAATGMVSGRLSAAGNYDVTISVSDGRHIVSTSFSWMISNSNVPPSIINPGDQVNELGAEVSLAIEASDPDSDSFDYAAQNLPVGLSIDSTTGMISGTARFAGTRNVTVSAHDGLASDSVEFEWLITEANVAPVLSNPGAQSTYLGSRVSLTVEASDANGDELTLSATGLPQGLEIDSATGVISGMPTKTETTNVEITVTDGSVNAVVTFNWFVTTAPEQRRSTNAGSGGGAFNLIWVVVIALLGLRRSLPKLAMRNMNLPGLLGMRSNPVMPAHIGRRQCLRGYIAATHKGVIASRWLTISALLLVIASKVSFAFEPAAAAIPAYDRVRILHSPRIIDEIPMLDVHGQAFDLSKLRGQVLLVFFGFTHCPDVCPVALEKLRQLEALGGQEFTSVAYVMISVDGERDTPAVLKNYLDRFSPSFIGLTGQPETVKPLAKKFRAAFFKGALTADGGYEVSHSPQVFVVDKAGRLRAEFYNASVESMAGVTRFLIAESTPDLPTKTN
ncbi:MAG: putative Ig domain-containing protein [Woeseia sp.]|nr:putative Ig domain-containing protein [Woeseia sp.]